jgi:hypothetical protein
MDRERIEQTLRLWQAEPDKAKGKPTVKARAEGSKAVMEHGTFSWSTDLPASLGGTNEAPSPTAATGSKARTTPVAPAVSQVFAVSMQAEQSIGVDPKSPGGVNVGTAEIDLRR